MLSFRQALSVSSFTIVKSLFISSSLSSIKVVSCAYLKLLIFPVAILILACHSPSLAFSMMYSAYKLYKQHDSLYYLVLFSHFWTSLMFPSSSHCCWLIHIQVSLEIGKAIQYSDILKNFPQFVVIHTVKGFTIVNESGKKNFFFWNSLISPWSIECWQFDLVHLTFVNHAYTSGSCRILYRWIPIWRMLTCSHVKWAQQYSSLNILCQCPCKGLKWKLTFSSSLATAEFSKVSDTRLAAL